MRRLSAFMLSALAVPALGQNAAPFCLVSQTGQANCFYYNIDACRMAQGTLGGMCAPNPNAMQQPTQIRPAPSYVMPPAGNPADAFVESYERAAKSRRDRELHQAQLRALDAQTAAAQRAAPLPQISVLYKCAANDGTPVYTATPMIGCVVVAVRE